MTSSLKRHSDRQRDVLLGKLLQAMPELPPEVKVPASDQYEIALAFAIGHAVHHTHLDPVTEKVSPLNRWSRCLRNT